jgi:hypothetical protein
MAIFCLLCQVIEPSVWDKRQLLLGGTAKTPLKMVRGAGTKP